MAGSFREGAGPGDAHAPPPTPTPPLSQFLALDALPSWGSDPKQPHWRHPELRRALASDDQADELRRIRASVQDSVGKANRRRFGEHQAENWWNENREKVYERYNVKSSERVISSLNPVCILT